MPPYYSGFKRRRYSPYGARKMRVLVPAYQNTIGAGRVFTRQGNAAAVIAATPALRGYARTQGRYSGRFSNYGSGNRPEQKFFDTTNTFNFDSTGEVPATGQLCIIPQGVNESERVGRKVTIKHIMMRGFLIPVAGTWTGGSEVIRLMLVQDTQCNGAAATWSGANGVLESDTVHAFRNLENSNRFKILKDWYTVLNAQAGVTTSFNQTTRTFFFSKNCSIPIEWDSVATTGALTTIRSNNLFLIARGANDDQVAYSGVTRLRYIDN